MNNKYLKTGMTVCAVVCAVIFLWAWITIVLDYCSIDYASSLRGYSQRDEDMILAFFKSSYLALMISGIVYLVCGGLAVFSRGKVMRIISMALSSSVGLGIFTSSVSFVVVAWIRAVNASSNRANIFSYLTAYWSELAPIIAATALLTVAAVFGLVLAISACRSGRADTQPEAV